MTKDGKELVLSGATGAYRQVRPAAALDRHFLCFWSNAISRERGGGVAVVPDGCVDLTWIDGELSVAGPDIGVSVLPFAPASPVVGIRFRPGAAARWLGLPMSKMVSSRVALEQFWGAHARVLAARMSDAQSTEERMCVLGSELGKLLCNLEPPSPDMEFVFNALRTESGGRAMSIILERLDVSPRTLRRRCETAFGYGPKTLDRILRFQRFLKLVQRPDKPHLAALAFEAGFADQAHLTREVRRLAGFSPAEIVMQFRGGR